MPYPFSAELQPHSYAHASLVRVTFRITKSSGLGVRLDEIQILY